MSSLPNEASSLTLNERLPPELIQFILEHLRYDAETLRRTSVISKQWLPTSRVYLFNHICLSAPRKDSTKTPCSVLYEVLADSPYIVYYIRHVSILAGAVSTNRSRRRWISFEDTLPRLLDILSGSSRVESLQIRLSSELWHELPLPLQTSIRSFINSPSMLDVDLTGFDVVDIAIFKQCRSLKKLKLSEITGDILVDSSVAEADADAWPARCDSLTLLDSAPQRISKTIPWVIATPCFCALREVRLDFHPLDGFRHVEALLSHVGHTLNSLHLQPVVARWPPANFISLRNLRALTSLRLSLGLTAESNPLPWATFLLSTLDPTNRIMHVTIDFRLGGDHSIVRALPWAKLDAAMSQPHLAHLRSLEVTCSAAQSSVNIAAWLVDEIPSLLPRSRARDVFAVYELKFTPSRFFYWPGALNWCGSLGIEDTS
ncbi:hypothetical protein C8R44DRAFT_887371 [Mycena epipterygia]|nr:hypothetical protein C8R44DRAFT_887371 [Mycena epipterygia]